MKKSLLFLIPILLLFSCTQDQHTHLAIDRTLESRLDNSSRTGSYKDLILPDSDDFNAIPQDPKNPLSAAKAKLGKFLFFETGLAQDPMNPSGRGTYSCASCHIPDAGFRPGRIQGIADGGIGFGVNGEGRTRNVQYEEHEMDVQGIRPLSVLNVAYVSNTLWNGQFGGGGVNEGTEDRWSESEVTEINHLGFSGLESQNIEGMDLHRMVVTKELMAEYGYTPYFDEAFAELPEEDRYTKETASLAISAYLRTLLTNQSPFQKWLKGDKTAMGEDEKRGALLFFGDAKCYNCHNGPALNAMEFYALGVKDLYETGEAFNTSADDKKNLGRGGFTGKAEDMFKFVVPQLYNMGDAPFYFHGSSKSTLTEVVEYFNDGVPENVNVPEEQIAPHLRPLKLTEQEIKDLVVFLDVSLHDPQLDRYVPEVLLSGNCSPNNDPFSKIDLDCE